jgi:putative ABC transport system substrate-binding protein
MQPITGSRRTILVLAALSLGGAALWLGLEERPSAKRGMRIGVLNHATVADPALKGLKAGLAESGYVEGRDLFIVYNGAVANPDALADEAARLVQRKPDLLVGLSTPAALALQKAAGDTRLPILFAPSSNPLGAGLVDSLVRPGRRTTGVMFGSQEPRRLEWLKRLLPDLKRLYIPYNPDDPSPVASLPAIEEAAARLGVALVHEKVRSVEELEAALNDLPAGIDAIWLPTDALVTSKLARFLAQATPRRIPITTPHMSGVTEGAFMSYGFDLGDLGRQASRLAVQILRGADASELPVEMAEFRLSLNLATAQQLGIAIADDVLAQARIVARPGDSAPQGR